MKIKEYKIRFEESLSPTYDSDEIESFFYLILEQEHQLKRVDLALNPDLEFSEEEIKKWNFYTAELQKQKPVQYLLGKTQFFGLEFFVNKNTLIPRPETEELVDWIIKENQFEKGLKILDIGTGSGCIAISLAKNLATEVFAFDISEEALMMAQKNADHNRTFVHFVEFDILNEVWEGEKFDIIASNPPYVRELEKEQIKPNVLEYEPHLALFVADENPLLFYEKIADFAKKHLSENGKLYFEINQYLGKETSEMLKNKGFKNAILKKDIYGNDRMIRAY
ncbi:MAG: peptide chain release factor N(5)-glutamine methyltransferase [Flavobacteriaceae bacterium]